MGIMDYLALFSMFLTTVPHPQGIYAQFSVAAGITGMFREKRSRRNLLSMSVSILSRVLVSLPSIIWGGFFIGPGTNTSNTIA